MKMEDSIKELVEEKFMELDTVKIYGYAGLNYVIYGITQVADLFGTTTDTILTGINIIIGILVIIYTIYKILNVRLKKKINSEEYKTVIIENTQLRQELTNNKENSND